MLHCSEVDKTQGVKWIHLPIHSSISPHPQTHNSYIFTLQILTYSQTPSAAMCCVTLPHHPPQNMNSTVTATFYKIRFMQFIFVHFKPYIVLLVFLAIYLRGKHKMCMLAKTSLASSFWMSKYFSEIELGGRGQERYTYPRATLSLSLTLTFPLSYFCTQTRSSLIKESLKSYSPRYPLLTANTAHPHTRLLARIHTGQNTD